MEPSAFAVLARRVDALEQENRALRRSARLRGRLGAVGLIGLVALLCGGADVIRDHKTVEAEQFQLKDQNGNVRVAIGMENEGATPYLVMTGRGKAGMILRFRPDGLPYIGLKGAEDEDRLVLDVGPEGNSNIGLFDARGVNRLAHGVTPEGNTRLGLLDPANKYRVMLDLAPGQEPRFVLLDKDGNPVFQAPRP